MQRAALGVPAGRVGAAGAVKQLLRLRQTQVVGADFEVEQHHLDIEEEIEVAMHHVERDGRIAWLCHDPQRRDVVTPENPHRRLAVTIGRLATVVLRTAFAIEEALHIGQEAHELVVVALVKAAAVAGVLLDLFTPGRGIAEFAQHLPGAMVPVLCISNRHQPHGPEQGLAEMLHGRCAGGGCCGPWGGGDRRWNQHRASVCGQVDEGNPRCICGTAFLRVSRSVTQQLGQLGHIHIAGGAKARHLPRAGGPEQYEHEVARSVIGAASGKRAR